MQLSVQADQNKLTKKLSAVQKRQIPFAASQALNTLTLDIRNTVQLALPKYFQVPTPYLARGAQVDKSTKQNIAVKIGSRSKTFGKGQGAVTQASIMEKQIKDGIRLPKSKAIPFPVPANMKTNRYGNLPRGKINKLLTDKDRYFSGTPKGIKNSPGIWGRMPKNSKRKKSGGRTRMVIAWEPKAIYKGGRFPFKRIVEKTFRTNFRKRFDFALRKALETSR